MVVRGNFSGKICDTGPKDGGNCGGGIADEVGWDGSKQEAVSSKQEDEI